MALPGAVFQILVIISSQNSTRSAKRLGIADRVIFAGYRTDDYGNSAAAATELIVSSSTFSGSGIIERNTDYDWFSFSTVTGLVDDIRPLVHTAAIFIVPLHIGGGTRLKIVEALA